MQLPLQITVRNVALSEVAEVDTREKADMFDWYYDHIMICHVTVDAPHRHHRKGLLYDVRIDLTVPGGELVIRREPNVDIYMAIRDAVDAARRQREDFARRQRGAVKTHDTPPHGRVSQLFPEEGYGFLETPGGREIYFYRNSVLHGGFDRLKIGSEVRFAEE